MLPLQPTYQRRAPQRHLSEGLRVSVGHTWISVFDARRATFRPLPRIFFTAFQFRHGVIRKSWSGSASGFGLLAWSPVIASAARRALALAVRSASGAIPSRP